MFMKPPMFCCMSAAWSIAWLAMRSPSIGFVLGCAFAFFLSSLSSSERITSKPCFICLNMLMLPTTSLIRSESREDLRFLHFELRLGQRVFLAQLLQPLELGDVIVSLRR